MLREKAVEFDNNQVRQLGRQKKNTQLTSKGKSERGRSLPIQSSVSVNCGASVDEQSVHPTRVLKSNVIYEGSMKGRGQSSLVAVHGAE